MTEINSYEIFFLPERRGGTHEFKVNFNEILIYV